MVRFGNLRLWIVCDAMNCKSQAGMPAPQEGNRIVSRIWGLCLVLVLLLWCGAADAGQLDRRLASFPNWEGKPSVQVAQGDLVYPDWMVGTWNVTSTLVDLAAPLAPNIMTPGFEGNRPYLNQPVKFQVRFVKNHLPVASLKLIPQPVRIQKAVVADRAFNGLNLARAYLGDRAVVAVKVDPNSPNRQITLLQGERQLISIVSGRATETPDENQLVTCEVFQQQFRRPGASPFFNEVESTTAYHYRSRSVRAILADQVTAVYLSPQDPNYFTAGSRPVALYRYRLEFFPNE